MTDPLSVPGSVAGLLSLGIQATQSLVDFYTVYKHQDSELLSITKRLDSLLDIFQSLQKVLRSRKFQPDEQDLLKTIESSIQDCDELIQELQDECQKFNKVRSDGVKDAVKAIGRRATYPFRQSTLQKLDEDIGEIRANLSTALDVLQLKDSKSIQDDISEVKLLLDLVRNNQISSDIREWLKAPDASVDHNAACSKRHPGTGMWLVSGEQYTDWLTKPNSTLWARGFAGSGKSVLCSTAVQYALRHRRANPDIGLAFFYFTFRDDSKQDESSMLRALMLQLSSQCREGNSDLKQIHGQYRTSVPPTLVLIEYFRRLISRFHHVYIMLDALDECPRDTLREGVLSAIETIRNWNLQGLHLFVTSRDEPDIRDSLNLTEESQVEMRSIGIDSDIASYVSGQFDNDRRLKKWLPYHDKIQDALAERANGVFRWVECQFKSLYSCPRSEDHLDRLLRSLPRSLDETYERMLCNIDQDQIDDVRRILTLLCYARRPMTVPELIDGVATSVKEPIGLNRKHRLQDADDLRALCPGFIDITHGNKHQQRWLSLDPPLVPILRIAHFSVQEYLESERLRHQKAAVFSLDSVKAHAEIAEICLIYVLEPDLPKRNSGEFEQVEKDFPLNRYAAEHWPQHYKYAENSHSKLDRLISALFQNPSFHPNFCAWTDFQHGDSYIVNWPDVMLDYDGTVLSICWKDPIFQASRLGLDQTLEALLRDLHSEGIRKPDCIFNCALIAASLYGHEKVAKRLLGYAADPDTDQAKRNSDCALMQAASEGHKSIVQLLLDHGAGHHTAKCKNIAMARASMRGHSSVVELLLDRGADVNNTGTRFVTALTRETTASRSGNIVHLLLEMRTDVRGRACKSEPRRLMS